MSDPASRLPASVDVLQLEQSLRGAVPEAVFAPGRVVRRIIRADLDLPLVRARVPHRESIALPPSRLRELADVVWALPASFPDTILLVARPSAEAFATRGAVALAREYWRRLYHACIDVAARRWLAEHESYEPAFRALVADVGDMAFAEAAAVLTQEGLLRQAGDPREAMAEFMAVVLELSAFAPRQLPVWFPGVTDHERLARLFGERLGADAILARTRPTALPEAETAGAAEEGTCTPEPAITPRSTGHLTRRAAGFLRRRSLAAARRGNDVRGMLLQWRLAALAGDDEPARRRAERSGGRRAADLVRRLDRAVGLGGVSSADATVLLLELVGRAGGSAWSQPARFLYDLQKSCVDSERESYRTRLLSWACTLGRSPLVKPLPAQRVALIHRHVASALRRLPLVGLPGPAAAMATDLVTGAMRTSEAALRERLTPPVREALTAAGLVPTALVEQAAFDKLVAELLDDVVDRGFESFGNVRDALSRSQVKLPDLGGVDELVAGDALLRADRNLAAALDGAYRRAPIYLLAMQRLSAVAFGVPLGRAVTLHLLLPFGGAWILWRGLEHIVEPITHYALGAPVHIYSRWAVAATGIAVWVLMHLPAVRAAVLEGFRAAGGLVQLLVVTLPRRLLRLPLVERVLKSRPVRFFRRYAWSPLVFTAIAWLLFPYGGSWLSRRNPWLPVILFSASSALLNSPPGRALQERTLEALGRAVQQIHARLIVGLVSWVIDTFRRAMDFVEGTLYAVDEHLRFRSDESTLALGVKAVLTTLWSAVDWVVRFCVTLLIEPQLNPIKHFPVVTVSHKLLVPSIPMVAANLAAATGMERGLALTTVTFVSTATPGVFGFLAWELKENWRLYAANRPRTLRPVQVGRHGESMRRLLLPGFHSGTIPKLFATLRRHARGHAEDELAELRHDIAAFVDDECLGLLRRTRALDGLVVRVADVRLATNQVTVRLAADEVASEPIELEFRQRHGTLQSRLAHTGWLTHLAVDRQRLVRLAIAGLECLCGADFTTVADAGRSESLPVEPIDWDDWRAAWERERAEGAGPGSRS